MSVTSAGTNNEPISFFVTRPDNIILTRNAINYYYGAKGQGQTNTYAIGLTDINGVSLQFGTVDAGSWLLDCDSGILTFYDDINSTNTGATVDADLNPPRISFWRYEGLIGNNTVMNVQDF